MKRKALLFLMMLTMGATGAMKAQDLADYTFSTGTSSSKWITLSSNATEILVAGNDDAASSLTNIGFTSAFPFGDGTYNQFWVNDNGVFSFASSTSTGSGSGQFTSSSMGTAQPKICGIARDMSTRSNCYVKYELTGTVPNRVLVCEFLLTKSYSAYGSGNADVSWQVQLHEADSKVVIVYGAAPTSSNTPSSYQIGLGQSSSNFWTVDPSSHTATHHTEAVSTNYSVWPGENRYYEFCRPVGGCEDFESRHRQILISATAMVQCLLDGVFQETQAIIGPIFIMDLIPLME